MSSLTTTEPDPVAERPARRVPAEPEFWILVLGDLALFTVLFFVWTTGERADPAHFADGRATLARGIGIANTLVLLAGSAAVVRAIAALRRDDERAARAAYGLAILGGAVFLVLKAVEYAGHLWHGVDALAGPFYIDYFVFTGVHALHVVLGMVLLGVARARVGRGPAGAARPMVLQEAAATYWHVIDIVWIVLFTLIYLG